MSKLNMYNFDQEFSFFFSLCWSLVSELSCIRYSCRFIIKFIHPNSVFLKQKFNLKGCNVKVACNFSEKDVMHCLILKKYLILPCLSHCHQPLLLHKMVKRSFCPGPNNQKTTVRIVYALNISKRERQGPLRAKHIWP